MNIESGKCHQLMFSTAFLIIWSSPCHRAWIAKEAYPELKENNSVLDNFRKNKLHVFLCAHNFYKAKDLCFVIGTLQTFCAVRFLRQVCVISFGSTSFFFLQGHTGLKGWPWPSEWWFYENMIKAGLQHEHNAFGKLNWHYLSSQFYHF